MDRAFIFYFTTAKGAIIAGLIKELLLDASLNRLSVDMHSDLILAVQSAVQSRVLNHHDIKILDLFLSGFTATEIAARLIQSTESIQTSLEHTFSTIEEHSGFTDEKFIDALEKTQRYRKTGLQRLQLFLNQHGKDFDMHSLEDYT